MGTAQKRQRHATGAYCLPALAVRTRGTFTGYIRVAAPLVDHSSDNTWCLALLGRVGAGTQKMQRHVRLVSDYPTVVSRRAGWDVKQVARFHFDHFAALDRDRGASRNDQSHMFDVAVVFSNVWTNMLRPFPTR